MTSIETINNTTFSVNGTKIKIDDTTPTGRQILVAAGLHPVDDYALLARLSDGRLEEISSDEVIHLNQLASTTFFALKTDRLFYFVLNETKFPWASEIDEERLRELGNIPDDADIWLERKDQPDARILRGAKVSLTGDGVERFYSRNAVWLLDVQGVRIESSEPTITVRHALELAKINPDKPWTFILKVAGKPKQQVELTTIIDLRTPGIERLRVMPKVINNGEGPQIRREFKLLEKDEAFLNNTMHVWETFVCENRRWLLIHHYNLPAGYTQSHVDLAIEIPEKYPAAELDMFYCFPAATLTSGKAIDKADVQQSIRGSTFQRWSRHRENSIWSPTDDSVITHLGLVEESLTREVAL